MKADYPALGAFAPIESPLILDAIDVPTGIITFGVIKVLVPLRRAWGRDEFELVVNWYGGLLVDGSPLADYLGRSCGCFYGYDFPRDAEQEATNQARLFRSWLKKLGLIKSENGGEKCACPLPNSSTSSADCRCGRDE